MSGASKTSSSFGFPANGPGGVGHGWVNGYRDPTRTLTRRRTDAAGGRMAHGGTSFRCTAEATTIEVLDPEVRAAIDDVDRTLIALSLQQSPWSRLRSATRMAQTLGRLRRALTSQGG